MKQLIQVDWQDTLCTITLNRPEKANSLTADMLQAIVAAVEAASTRANVLMLTGVGRVFSAGADLDAARAGLTKNTIWEELSGAIAGAPCLTIAALNGTVAGGAFGMVLACDLRVCVESASFFYPVMKLGFLPQPSDPARLTALVGPARAKMISDGRSKGQRSGRPELGAYRQTGASEWADGSGREPGARCPCGRARPG